MANVGFDARSAFMNFSGQGNYSRTLISSLSRFYEDNDYYLYTPGYEENNNFTFDFKDRKNVFVRKGEEISYMEPETVLRDKIGLFHGIRAELPDFKGKIKTVISMHDTIFMRYPEYYRADERERLEMSFRKSCMTADKILAISRQTADDVIKFFNVPASKIEVVYQGCDREFYIRPSEDEIAAAKRKYSLPDKFILNVGKIEPRKNLLSVIRAMKEIPQEYSLVAVGKPTHYVRSIKAAIHELGMENRVRLILDPDFRDLPAIYASALITTYVSFFEGFGLPVLEALSCGTPVITSGTSSMPEAGGDAAMYVEPANVDEISRAIQLLINSPTSRKSMIEKGYLQAAKFREDIFAKNVYEIYSALLK